MPRKSYAELQEQNRQLMQNLRELTTDPVSGLTNRAGVPYELARLEEPPRYLVGLYCDYPYRSIHKAVHTRSADVVLRAHYAQNLYLFWTVNEPSGLVDQLRDHLRKVGTPNMIVYCTASSYLLPENIEKDIRTLEAVAQARREGYQA